MRLMVRETVAVETFARLATCRMSIEIPQTESADDISRESVFPNCMLKAGLLVRRFPTTADFHFAKDFDETGCGNKALCSKRYLLSCRSQGDLGKEKLLIARLSVEYCSAPQPRQARDRPSSAHCLVD